MGLLPRLSRWSLLQYCTSTGCKRGGKGENSLKCRLYRAVAHRKQPGVASSQNEKKGRLYNFCGLLELSERTHTRKAELYSSQLALVNKKPPSDFFFFRQQLDWEGASWLICFGAEVCMACVYGHTLLVFLQHERAAAFFSLVRTPDLLYSIQLTGPPQ